MCSRQSNRIIFGLETRKLSYRFSSSGQERSTTSTRPTIHARSRSCRTWIHERGLASGCPHCEQNRSKRRARSYEQRRSANKGRMQMVPALRDARAHGINRTGGCRVALSRYAARLCCSACGRKQVEAWPVRPNQRDRHPNRPRPLPPLDECRQLVASVRIDSRAQLVNKYAACIGALRDRWPQLTASAALFVVQQLEPRRH